MPRQVSLKVKMNALLRFYPLLLLLMLILISHTHALESGIPEDVEEIEIDVAKLKGMPGVKIVENTEDAYAAIKDEKEAEQKLKAHPKDSAKRRGKGKKTKGRNSKKKANQVNSRCWILSV